MMAYELPAVIRELVGGQALPLYRCAAVATTDERTRRRRQHFGDYLLPVSVFLKYDARFVLVRYADRPRPGGWTIPGGYSEPGEPLRSAAIREAREECGLDVELERPVGVVATDVTSPTEGRLLYYLTVFRAHSRGGILVPRDPLEIDEVRLAAFDEIEALAARQHFPSINSNLDAAFLECLRRAVER